MSEKVILNAKLNDGHTKTDDEFASIKKLAAADLNSQRAAADIAKSLVQDYMLLVTVACCKAVFGTMPNRKDVLDSLYKMWEERTSINLSQETKMFQDAIFKAVNAGVKVSEDMTKKMNEQIQVFCNTRDAAVDLAKQAVKGISETLVSDSTEEEKKENDNERTSK